MNSDQPQPPTRTLVDYVGLIARGFAMGAANIVPGVSGGTMALIMGIYEELIQSVRSVLNRAGISVLCMLLQLPFVSWHVSDYIVRKASGAALEDGVPTDGKVDDVDS